MAVGCDEQERGTPGKLLQCRNHISEKTHAGLAITVIPFFLLLFYVAFAASSAVLLSDKFDFTVDNLKNFELHTDNSRVVHIVSDSIQHWQRYD